MIHALKKAVSAVKREFKRIAADRAKLVLLPVFLVIMIVSASFIIKNYTDYARAKKISVDTKKTLENFFNSQDFNSQNVGDQDINAQDINNLNLGNHTPDPETAYASAAAAPTESIVPLAGTPDAAPAQTPPALPVPAEYADISAVEQIEALRAKYDNDDIVAFIAIPGTAVWYPVVQAGDNEYYLKHDVYKTVKSGGSIFMDYRNDISADKNIALYGHNMMQDIMFHDLRYYVYDSGPAYYSSHKYVILVTRAGTEIWEIFSAYNTSTDFYYIQVHFKDDEDFYSLAKQMKAKSLFDTGVDIAETDRILTLSTCTNTDENTRIVVNAKLLDRSEWDTIDVQAVRDYLKLDK